MTTTSGALRAIRPSPMIFITLEQFALISDMAITMQDSHMLQIVYIMVFPGRNIESYYTSSYMDALKTQYQAITGISYNPYSSKEYLTVIDTAKKMENIASGVDRFYNKE